MILTETNWHIGYCGASTYALYVDNKEVFKGQYSKCLCILGALQNNCTLEYAVKLANSVDITEHLID